MTTPSLFSFKWSDIGLAVCRETEHQRDVVYARLAEIPQLKDALEEANTNIVQVIAERDKYQAALRRLQTDFSGVLGSSGARASSPSKRPVTAGGTSREFTVDLGNDISATLPARGDSALSVGGGSGGVARHVLLQTGPPLSATPISYPVLATASSPVPSSGGGLGRTQSSQGSVGSGGNVAASSRAPPAVPKADLGKRPAFSAAVSPHTSRLAPKPESVGTLHIASAAQRSHKPVISIELGPLGGQGQPMGHKTVSARAALVKTSSDAPFIVPVSLADIVPAPTLKPEYR